MSPITTNQLSTKGPPVIYPLIGVYGNLFLCNASLMIILIILPLRMLDLGFSEVDIGIVVGVPMTLQFIARPIGGGLSDRFGGRSVLIASSIGVTIVILIIMFSTSFWVYFFAQVLRSLATGLFRPSTKSYASFIDPLNSTSILGRHTSVTAASDILGVVAGGYLVLYAGFDIAFGTSAVFAFSAVIFSVLMPVLGLEERQNGNFGAIMRNFLRLLLTNRPLFLGFLCAFVVAIPFALIGSFYPVYFKKLGFDEGTIGILGSVITGSILVSGLMFGRLFSMLGPKWIFAGGVLGLGMAFSLIQMVNSPFSLFALMILTGSATGVLDVFRNIISSDHSSVHERGSALAATGLGFVASTVIIPVAFGIAVQRFSYETTFFLLGLLLIVLGLLTKPLFSWARYR
ncbi:MAG: MFS transporter [Firmicutes bacterium]|nr:MFS transporter [Bacillota bacterium]